MYTKVTTFLLTTLLSVSAFSYVLSKPPVDKINTVYETSVRPPLKELCDDCYKNIYTTGETDQLVEEHWQIITGNKDSNTNEAVD